MQSADVIIVATSAVVTGVVTGAISSLGTIASIRVHIEYLRATIEKHDKRLREVERETHAVVVQMKKRDEAPASPRYGSAED